MAEESIVKQVEAGLKPRKCCRCRLEYTLFERDGEGCRFDDHCPKCTVKAALRCVLCVSHDRRDLVRGLKEFLDELEE